MRHLTLTRTCHLSYLEPWHVVPLSLSRSWHLTTCDTFPMELTLSITCVISTTCYLSLCHLVLAYTSKLGPPHACFWHHQIFHIYYYWAQKLRKNKFFSQTHLNLTSISGLLASNLSRLFCLEIHCHFSLKNLLYHNKFRL